VARTYEPIASQTLGSDATSHTFSSIPGTFSDLRIIITGRRNNTSTPNSFPVMRVNSDTGSNYSATHVYGFNSAAYSARDTSATGFPFHVSGLPRSDEAFSIFTIDLMSYANTNVNKTFLSAMACPIINVSNYIVGRSVGLWRSTSAITSVTLEAGGASWHTGSTFSLYAIKAA
jgi:hypothetical protein